MVSYIPPPLDPGLCFPDYIYRVSSAYPEREIALILDESDAKGNGILGASLQSITWAQLMTDVQKRTQHLLEMTRLKARRPGDDVVTVGLLAPNGYSYLVNMTAMFMLRWTVLLISVKNSEEAVYNLMHSTGAVCLIVDRTLPLFADGLIDESFITVDLSVAPKESRQHLEDIFWDSSNPSNAGFSRNADLLREADNPALYMHTSGTTGHPKPIAWTHQFILSSCLSVTHDRSARAEVIYTLFPLFHGGGFALCLFNLLGAGSTFTFIEGATSTSHDAIIRHIRALSGRKVDIAVPPSILEDMYDASSRDSLDLSVLQGLNTVVYGGAPLRQEVGDFLSQHQVRLMTWGGTTEAGEIACFGYHRDPEDWAYMELVDAFEYHFQKVEEDSNSLLHTLIISPGYITPPVLNHRDPVGFWSNDLWLCHYDPKKRNFWKPAGRTDDVTVLSNGEKTDNKQLETLLCASPLIAQAAIFGSGRFLNGAIISPSKTQADSTQDISAYIDAIWPHIVNTNRSIPRHSRLIRPLLLIEQPSKPFIFSDKWTLKSKATAELYRREIDEAYRTVEEGFDVTSVPPLPQLDSTVESVERLKAYITSLLGSFLERPVQEDEDFFLAGMDSLVATLLRSAILGALKHYKESHQLPRNIIYTYPTVSNLALYLHRQLFPHGVLNSKEEADNFNHIQTTIARLSHDFTSVPLCETTTDERLAGDVYAITGSTGSLGASFTSLLLHKSEVRKLYLLNRPHEGLSMTSRLKEAFAKQGLDHDLLISSISTGRVILLNVNLAEPKLGIDETLYDELRANVTHIVHIAWTLDFNLVFSSYMVHVLGVRHLIDLALSSTSVDNNLPHLTFLSSIGVVARYGTGSVPESPLNSLESCLPQGYSYAKYASEKIIEAAANQRPGFRASIIRSGQIAGALRTGAWSRKEYMPTLIRLSMEVGLVPQELPSVRWLPVDVAADVVYHNTKHSSLPDNQSSLTFYHLENNISTAWSEIVQALTEFRSVNPVLPVPVDKWFETVRLRSSSNIGGSLMWYFEDHLRSAIPKLDTTNATRFSESLLDYEVDSSLIKLYIQYACMIE
ncbi:hypothetical protein BDP27DRAFT_102090 [Rhodocollybia butyracea]|uniref:Carrier domain-containing protein n=1 Tax=Rhodocollybia butyracea TaxID=206335 RepID=A0A9P5PGN6_9AGAR|nr:hypothetical protein BDP27DRAFT_102090 [Rhodocollybia butyracea]